jgi:glycosyltransferase involved in cell wall biosynthesis
LGNLKKTKTIWILNHHAVTPEIGGGTRHYDFGRELIKRGYNVYIFASSFIHYKYVDLLDDGKQTEEQNIDGIHWIWIKTRTYKGNGMDRILGMTDYYRFMMRNYRNYPKPQIVIGSAVHLLACVAGYKISKKLDANFIGEIRDLWPETLIELGNLKRNSPIAKAMYLLEKYVYKRSDRIIITAPGMADYIAKRGVDRERIIYINNGVDVESFDLREKTHDLNESPVWFDDKVFNAVYLGAFGRANAIETIIEAGKILKEKSIADISFALIGDGPEKERLIDRAGEYGLDNYKFYSTVDKRCVPAILARADCLIFSGRNSPLYKYGVSANKLFDYMCSGKPVIFAINSFNDFVKESGGGISIEPENPEQMANAILELYYMSKSDRKIVGGKGREFVEHNFDIPILVDKLEEVFADVEKNNKKNF